MSYPVRSLEKAAAFFVLVMACGEPHVTPKKTGAGAATQSACTRDSDCGDGKTCEGGICSATAASSCSDDGDCSFGEHCSSQGRCVACTRDEHCDDGETCSGGACVSGDGDDNEQVECETREDCSPGLLCDGFTCVPCDSDEQCEASEVCTASGRCLNETDADIGDWTCEPAYFGDEMCDCGCGELDIDCEEGCAEPGCAARSCEFCYDDTGAEIACEGGSDDGGGGGGGGDGGDGGAWTCEPTYNGDGSCDCGCGEVDSDCASGCAAPGCNAEACEYCFAAGGEEVPCRDEDDGGGDDGGDDGGGGDTGGDGWTCPSEWEGDGYCDCGCGEIDVDCAGGGCAQPGCTAAACEYCVDANGDAEECGDGGGGGGSGGWTCPLEWQGDGWCDCGCGALDPDCGGGGCSAPGCSAQACQYCVDASGEGETCGATDAPVWSCDPEYYGDGWCDCGCETADPDCNGGGCTSPGCSASACEYCADATGATSECGTGGGSSGGQWTCNPVYEGDGLCDCGCGTIDPDCDIGCTSPGCYAADCQYCFYGYDDFDECGG